MRRSASNDSWSTAPLANEGGGGLPRITPASKQSMRRRASDAHRLLRREPALLASGPTDRSWAHTPRVVGVNTATASEGRSALPAAAAATAAAGLIRHDATAWRSLAAAQARVVVSEVPVLATRASAAVRSGPVLAVQAVVRTSTVLRLGTGSPAASTNKRSAAPTAEMGLSEPRHVGRALLDTRAINCVVEVTLPALLADVPPRHPDAVVAVAIITAALASNERPVLHPLRPAGQHEHARALHEEPVAVASSAGH